jgi:heme exporter protein B
VFNLLKFYFKQFSSNGIFTSIILSSNLPLIILFFLSGINIISDYWFALIISINMVCFIGLSDRIFKTDFDSGILSHILVTHELYDIIWSKIIFFSLLMILSLLSNIFFLNILFFIPIASILHSVIPCLVVIFVFVINLTLVGTIRLYFETNNSIISSSTIPFMIGPSILAGIYMQTGDIHLIYILVGLLMVLSPVLYLLIWVLLRDIYNN